MFAQIFLSNSHLNKEKEEQNLIIIGVAHKRGLHHR